MAQHPMVTVAVTALVLLALLWVLVIARHQSKPDPQRRMAERHSYETSCHELARQGLLETGANPPLPARMPRFDDECPGVTFYKTRLADNVLESLTLPRTFFGRSEIDQVTFRNTDLSESVLCWNNFDGVDFTDADLSRCDLRASIYLETMFVGANLQSTDLRHSTFKACDFSRANLGGAKLTRKGGKQLRLSKEQERAVDWQESEGPEPPGG